MARSAVIHIGVLALAVGLWIVMAPTAEPDLGPEAGPAAEESVPDAGSFVETEQQAAPSVASISRTEVEAPVTPETSDVLPSLAEGEGQRIEVVNDADGKPVGGALVFVVDTGRADKVQLQQAMMVGRDISRVVEAMGERYRTRADGSVVVPEVVDNVVLAARAPGRYVFVLRPEPDAEGTFVMRLMAERSIRVQVNHPDGTPAAGIPVVLRVEQGPGHQDVLQAESDAEGRAVLHRLSVIDDLPFDGEIVIALGLALDPAVQTEIDLAALPEDILEFVLPPTGALEVEVVGREGGLAEGAVPVMLQIVPEGATAPTQMPMAADASATTEDGIAVFPRIGLGLQLSVFAFNPSDQSTWQGTGEGPQAPGERARIVLRPDLAAPNLVFLVMGMDGKPLANRQFQTVLTDKSESSESRSQKTTKTDAEGRARLRLDLDQQHFEGHRVLEVQLARPTEGELASAARVELPTTLIGGDNDLGTLLLEPLPIVASGIVVDIDGKPIGKVQMNLQVKTFWGKEETNFYWQQLYDVRGTSAKDGSFTLSGYVESQELLLSAFLQGWQSTSEPIQVGATGLRLTMERAAELSGRVLVDPGIPPSSLQVLAESAVDGKPGSISQPGREGQFQFDSLGSGRYHFSVRDRIFGDSLYRAEDVLVEVGSGTDPRVAEIDLRGKLNYIQLTFVDESEQKIQNVNVRNRDKNGTTYYAYGGALQIVTAEQSLNLAVSASGHQAQLLEQVSGEQTIRLKRGRDVELVLDLSGAVPSNYEVSINLTESELPGANGHRIQFDENGRCRTRIGGAGRYRIDYWVSAMGSNSQRGFGADGFLDVLEAEGFSTYTIPLDVEALEKAIAKD